MYVIKKIPEDFVVDEIPLFTPAKEGRYSYLLLRKKDYDTEKAVIRVAEHFNLPRKSFSYAGSKDRHAVTCQYISVKGSITAKDFGDFSVEPAGKGDIPLSLGSLKGNRFTITVRNISQMPSRADHIINYFDEQRFGRNNLEIGKAILKGDLKEAARLIDAPEVKAHLEELCHDYVGAIRKIPYKILNMYIHAVQSFLWNEAAALYCRRLGGYDEAAYQHGVFVFPHEKPGQLALPLISFDTQFDDTTRDIYEKILNDNNLAQRDFIIRSIPDITPLGSSRDLVADIIDLNMGQPEEDDLFPGKKKVQLAFMLGKGSYATIAIRKIMKNS